MKNYKNVIYIITNPLYAGYIKIGYASDLSQRLSSLNTGMLRNFEAYAVYETSAKNADKKFHAIIDELAPILRAKVMNGQKVQDKEFFKLEPEQAYELLLNIASMTGTENKVHKVGVKDDLPPVPPYDQAKKKADGAPASSHAAKKTSEKPVGFIWMGRHYDFDTWAGMLTVFVETLSQRPDFLSKIRSDKHLGSKKHPLASDREEDIRFGKHRLDNGLWYSTNYSAESIKRIGDKLASVFGVDVPKLIYNDKEIQS